MLTVGGHRMSPTILLFLVAWAGYAVVSARIKLPEIPCQLPKLNVLYVLDSSRSINHRSSANYDHAKAVIQRSLHLLTPGSQIAVIRYGRLPKYAVPFTDIDYRAKLRRAIKSIRYTNDMRTNTAAALQFASDVLTQKAASMPNRHKVVVVLTEGRSQDWKDYNGDERAAVLNEKAIVFAVGVGKRTNKPELLKIAGGDSDRVLTLETTEDFLSLFIKGLCESVKKWDTCKPDLVAKCKSKGMECHPVSHHCICPGKKVWNSTTSHCVECVNVRLNQSDGFGMVSGDHGFRVGVGCHQKMLIIEESHRKDAEDAHAVRSVHGRNVHVCNPGLYCCMLPPRISVRKDTKTQAIIERSTVRWECLSKEPLEYCAIKSNVDDCKRKHMECDPTAHRCKCIKPKVWDATRGKCSEFCSIKSNVQGCKRRKMECDPAAHRCKCVKPKVWDDARLRCSEYCDIKSNVEDCKRKKMECDPTAHRCKCIKPEVWDGVRLKCSEYCNIKSNVENCKRKKMECDPAAHRCKCIKPKVWDAARGKCSEFCAIKSNVEDCKRKEMECDRVSNRCECIKPKVWDAARGKCSGFCAIKSNVADCKRKKMECDPTHHRCKCIKPKIWDATRGKCSEFCSIKSNVEGCKRRKMECNPAAHRCKCIKPKVWDDARLKCSAFCAIKSNVNDCKGKGMECDRKAHRCKCMKPKIWDATRKKCLDYGAASANKEGERKGMICDVKTNGCICPTKQVYDPKKKRCIECIDELVRKSNGYGMAPGDVGFGLGVGCLERSTAQIDFSNPDSDFRSGGRRTRFVCQPGLYCCRSDDTKVSVYHEEKGGMVTNTTKRWTCYSNKEPKISKFCAVRRNVKDCNRKGMICDPKSQRCKCVKPRAWDAIHKKCTMFCAIKKNVDVCKRKGMTCDSRSHGCKCPRSKFWDVPRNKCLEFCAVRRNVRDCSRKGMICDPESQRCKCVKPKAWDAVHKKCTMFCAIKRNVGICKRRGMKCDSRAHGCKCPKSKFWDATRKKCLEFCAVKRNANDCNRKGMICDPKSKRCKCVKPKAWDAIHKNCTMFCAIKRNVNVCKRKGMKCDSRAHGCKCPKSKFWDATRKKCLEFCAVKRNANDCNRKGMICDPKSQRCKCVKPKAWDAIHKKCTSYCSVKRNRQHCQRRGMVCDTKANGCICSAKKVYSPQRHHCIQCIGQLITKSNGYGMEPGDIGFGVGVGCLQRSISKSAFNNPDNAFRAGGHRVRNVCQPGLYCCKDYTTAVDVYVHHKGGRVANETERWRCFSKAELKPRIAKVLPSKWSKLQKLMRKFRPMGRGIIPSKVRKAMAALKQRGMRLLPALRRHT